MVLQLNEGEVNALLAFIDAGLKATGLQNAEAAAILSKNIQATTKQPADVPVTEKKEVKNEKSEKK